MRDVVIIGGGLSGLAAARELEKRGIPYRLIEVKKRLGGSIITHQQQGFTMDGGPFAFSQAADWSFLPELGLQDSLCIVHDSHNRDLVAFREGTQTLVDAFARDLKGSILYRMAVSSIGQLDGHFTLCMENGRMFEAAAIIVAAPARFAERMFHTLVPEFSLPLIDYGYDTILRASLGYRAEDLPIPPIFPWDVGIPFYYWTDDSCRAPAGHRLLYVGVRIPPHFADQSALIDEIHAHIKATGQPVISQLDYWPEADPLPPHTAGFADRMRKLEALLPAGVAIAGSDYHGLSLAERIRSGQNAARRVAGLFA